MRLVSFFNPNDRFGETIATDMSILEFIKWSRDNLGQICITYVGEMSLADFQRWKAEGRRTYMRGRIPV